MIGKSTCNFAILSIAVKSTQPPDRNECQGIAFGGKLWATRRASTSAILVVQNVKLWMEAWHSFFLWIFVTCYGKVSYFLKNVISQTDLSSSILFLISIDPIRVAYRFQTSYFNFEILFLFCIGSQTSVILNGDIHLLVITRKQLFELWNPANLTQFFKELYVAKIKNVSDLFLWVYNLHFMKSYFHQLKWLLNF